MVWDRENLKGDNNTQLSSITEGCSDTELLRKTFKERTQILKRDDKIIRCGMVQQEWRQQVCKDLKSTFEVGRKHQRE